MSRNLKRVFFLYLVLLNFFLFTSNLNAQNQAIQNKTNPQNLPKPIPIPNFSSYWINAKGQSFAKSKVINIQWVWSKEKPESKTLTPALLIRLESQFPADWAPQFLSSEGATIKFPLQKGSKFFEVETRVANPTIRYKFVDSKNIEHELTLILQSNQDSTIIHNSTTCEKAGHFLEGTANKSKSLFLIMQCQDYLDRTEYTIYHSSEFKWIDHGELKDNDPNNTDTYIEFKNSKSQEANVYSKTLLSDGIQDDSGGSVRFQIRYVPKIPSKKLSANAGLGTSYYTYSERPSGRASLALRQYSLTGKVNINYKLIPRVLDFGFNMFGNLLTLMYSPDKYNGYSSSDAKFYGINGRLGYRLPTKLGATEFYFLTGWYFWGMYVNSSHPKASYGIASLSGPQLFFMMNHMPKNKIGYWLYFKFALIANQLNISNLNNNEIAFGFGIQITPKSSKPMSVTLDISKAKFSNVGTIKPTSLENTMQLMSYTVGVQKVIY